ncbi:hypothetical protein HPB51_008069 [Rhipicephalus microplus]|uniref:Secreted protein n=1 Tax=Rhipicephalus microplus TaxID=6941 RepID=A0A9J6EGN8_RHIMP|nr:hypothetical protein HPB51_008069 [Rhipicephalus microplus]
MILPITALRLAVAAAVENVTTPLPGDFPDGDVIIWRRSDEGSDNSTWLPPPLPSSFIPDKPDPGFTPDYNTRIRLPQNSTDVLTVADIAEIESMLVRLNETMNDTSSFEGETPTERVRRSIGDEDEQDDDDDDNNVSPSKSDATSGLTAEGESVPGYSEDAQMRPAPQMDDQTSEFFSKFLSLKSGDRVEKTHEDLVEPSSLLQKDEDGDEQRGFYPPPSGIIDPGFAPDPNRQLLQRAHEEQRRKGLRQPESHVPNSHWQGYPGGSGIIDPGFAPRPIDPLLQRDLDLQRENGGRQVLGGQQENKMTPELNIVHADGSTQGYPPNAPFRGQGAEAPRMDDTLIQQTQGQARQDQEQLRPSASQAETGNSAETLTPSDSAVPESNRE